MGDNDDQTEGNKRTKENIGETKDKVSIFFPSPFKLNDERYPHIPLMKI